MRARYEGLALSKPWHGPLLLLLLPSSLESELDLPVACVARADLGRTPDVLGVGPGGEGGLGSDAEEEEEEDDEEEAPWNRSGGIGTRAG